MHNPPMNFLRTDILAELHDVVKNTEKDDSIRVLVLTGGMPGIFITHFSISELSGIAGDNQKAGLDRLLRSRLGQGLIYSLTSLSNKLMDASPYLENKLIALAKKSRVKNEASYLWLQMTRLYLAIERLNKVTICAINGPVNGGGVELAACFDFRFMAGDMDFMLGQPEILVGIVPGGGSTQRLPRIMGVSRALEWMLTGRLMDPAEAMNVGLLTGVFPEKELAKKVQEFADKLSLRPPVAVDAIKKSVHGGAFKPLARGLSWELVQSIRCLDTKDAQNALEGYLKLIKERVEVPEEDRISPEELFEILENAKIVDGFSGK